MKHNHAIHATMSILLLMSVITSGCARKPMDHSEGAHEKKGVCAWLGAKTGALIGGIGGAGIGAIVADAATGVTMSQGIGVGILAGGLVGSLIGNEVQIKCLKKDLAACMAERDRLMAELKACQDENAALRAEIERLKARIAELELQLSQRGTEVARIRIPNHVLFASGSDKLTNEGRDVLERARVVIERDYPGNPISIEGHTDNDPIRYSRWKSNWELGAARSLAVLHVLKDQFKVEGVNLSATTFGEYRPEASNETKEGKSANRRTEIVILRK